MRHLKGFNESFKEIYNKFQDIMRLEMEKELKTKVDSVLEFANEINDIVLKIEDDFNVDYIFEQGLAINPENDDTYLFNFNLNDNTSDISLHKVFRILREQTRNWNIHEKELYGYIDNLFSVIEFHIYLKLEDGIKKNRNKFKPKYTKYSSLLVNQIKNMYPFVKIDLENNEELIDENYENFKIKFKISDLDKLK